MVRIVDLPTTGTVDSNTYVPVFQNGKTKKASASSFGGGGGSVSDQIHSTTVKSTPNDADELGYLDSASAFSLVKMTWANLKTWLGALFVSKSGDTINGSLICGNGQTSAYPPAAIAANPTTHATSKRASMAVGAWLIGQDSNGNGTRDFFLYDTLAGTLCLIIDTSGNVLVTSGALGYGPGAGGQVTQDTSKSTAVTLNKPVGRIITAGDSLAAGTSVSFVLNNSHIEIGDIVLVVASGGTTGKEYQAWVSYVPNGQCIINLKNNSTGALSQVVGINFAIIKGALT